MNPTTTELVTGIGWTLEQNITTQPFMDSLSNEELDAVTALIDRMYRAVHIEKQKTKRQEPTK